jgi:hypothetical protein
MNQIIAKDFIFAWNSLQGVLKLSSSRRGEKATKAETDALIKALIEVHHKSHLLGLKQCAALCKRLLDQMQDPGCHRVWTINNDVPRYAMPETIPLPDFESIYWQAQNILSEFQNGLESIRMAVVFADKAEFFERDDLFGKEVAQAASQELNAEIKSAGNCIAMGLNTAAVFHLMRVAEFGLRALAKSVRAKVKHPLEFAEWGTVIEGCDLKLRNLKPKKRGKKKSAKLEYYSNAISECRAFKETWRDCVMHARRTDFQASETIAVFERMRDFLKRLAKEVPLK